MIYLDNNATTRSTSKVVEATVAYLTDCYFNASTSSAGVTGADRPRLHAAAAMKKLVNAEEPDCFIFTSGATESNNWVLTSLRRCGNLGKVVVSSIEHASVLEPALDLRQWGFDVVETPVDSNGVVRIDQLQQHLTHDCVLVSVMAANNETGAVQPIREIGELIRASCPRALFHTDATQAVGKMSVDLRAGWTEVDLASFSAHKFHGPKGIGGLYMRPGIEIHPMLLGGGQEDGWRSGTTNTPGLAGLAIAAEEAASSNYDAVGRLRDLFEARLKATWPDIHIHSQGVTRLPNTSFFSLPGMAGVEMADALAAEGIIVGTGAACSAGAIRPSRTLQSMGVAHEIATAGLRISLSRFSTLQEIEKLIDTLGALRHSLH
ncbi:MAG: cysteine desulfurase [Betaproteobacteria bacterium]|nr:cysteine desulfurase [Betaproteobacteria bacterium]